MTSNSKEDRRAVGTGLAEDAGAVLQGHQGVGGGPDRSEVQTCEVYVIRTPITKF